MKTQLNEEVIRRPEVTNQVKCKLMSLKCHRAAQLDGDDVYLKVNNKKFWPARSFARIRPSEEVTVNFDVISDGRGFVKIELWEKGFFSDDLLGSFQFVSIGANGKFSTDLTPRNKDIPPSYVLTWEM